MFEHPILGAIRRESFMPLGWFMPVPADGVPLLGTGALARFVILIGNAGPFMFQRFRAERRDATDTLDRWSKDVIGKLASALDAAAVFPFDEPPLPFLAWAKRSGALHQSPLGLSIHADFGLWHAYRAALLFPVSFDLPPVRSSNPCDSCESRPCLSACPVDAFDGRSFEVNACVGHIASPAGETCMSGGCLARRACPVGKAHVYEPAQMQFHMTAFRNSRLAADAQSG